MCDTHKNEIYRYLSNLYTCDTSSHTSCVLMVVFRCISCVSCLQPCTSRSSSCLCMLPKREQYLTPKSVQTVWCCSYIPRLAPWFRSPATQSTFHSFCGWFDSFLNARLEVQGAWLCSALMRLAVANPKVETLCLFLPFLTCCLQFLFQDGAW